MSHTARRAAVALLAVLGLLVSALLVLLPADSASAATTGRIVGEITGPGGAQKIRMTWFTKDWGYISKRDVNRGAYSLSLPPGTYWIQFTDRRPAYNIKKYAPTDIKVTLGAGDVKIKRVRMHRGAAITGTVRAGGRRAGGARVVAANAARQSFEVRANKKGQFALGGLPAGSFSVFTYERTGQWVARSTQVDGLRLGQVSNVAIRLTKRAGKLLVLLSAGGREIHKRVFVTAVSRKTGQFWTARASSDGSVTFEGLFPGRYSLVMPDVGNYLGREGNVVKGRVRPDHLAIGKFNLTQRGGWFDGIVVDAEDPSHPLAGALVQIFDKTGGEIDSATTGPSGGFHLGGALRDSTGWTIVAQPDPANGTAYLGEEGTPHRCKYGRAELTGLRVFTGQGTDAGAIELPHLAQQDRPSCVPSDAP
jgi:hypothetical protein